MAQATSEHSAKLKRAKSGVASSFTTSKPSPSRKTAGLPAKVEVGKIKNAPTDTVTPAPAWEMTAEEALRVNFVECEI